MAKDQEFYPLRKGFNDALGRYTPRDDVKKSPRKGDSMFGDGTRISTSSENMRHHINVQTSFNSLWNDD